MIDLVKVAYRARLPILAWGGHGVGKSDVFAHAAEELGIGFSVLNLSVLEPADLQGLPYREGKRTRYAPPDLLPAGGAGILLLEEINRVPRYLQAPCMGLVLARRIHDYELPEGWLVAAAANPQNSGYEVATLDPALRSRFLEVLCVPDPSTWLAWAADARVHPAVARFVSETPGVFEDPHANPRALEMVSRLLSAIESHPPSTDVRDVALTGVLKKRDWVAAFDAGAGALTRPLGPYDILEHYEESRFAVRRLVSEAKLDLVVASLEMLKRELTNPTVLVIVLETEEYKARAETFFGDLPADLRRQTAEWLASSGIEGFVIPERRRRPW
jgi:MoxR-like ATPase